MSEKKAVFNVHKVDVGKPLPPVNTATLNKAWESLGDLKVSSKLDSDLPCVDVFTSPNLFAVSVYRAFYDHYPLKINPNVVWLTIAQGFSTYVSGNSEALRSKFVSFEGKKDIEVIRENFARDHSKNDWENVFPSFSEEIAKHIGESTVKMIECDFSNTTVTDKVASQIVLMDVVKHYFNYSICGGCGIPYIELLGTLNDWKLIRKKAETLEVFSNPSDTGLKNWLVELLPILDQFVLAAEGKPDVFFWGSICNLSGGSGAKGLPITGWIQSFFPYLKERPVYRTEGMNSPPNFLIRQWRSAYNFTREHGVDQALAASLAKGNWDFPNGYGTKLEDLPAGLARVGPDRKSVV